MGSGAATPLSGEDRAGADPDAGWHATRHLASDFGDRSEALQPRLNRHVARDGERACRGPLATSGVNGPAAGAKRDMARWAEARI